MFKRFITISFFIFYWILVVYAQPDLPPNGEVYRDDIVPRVDILIHPDSLELLYEDVESYHEFPAVFIFNNGNVHDTIENIGFRLRGNTSRYSQKKSFKVSFNTFEPGRKYYGFEKLNLNGEHNDPSIIRSKLCWNILRKLEIPAPRSNHVEVYINGDYYGLYISVEHIDENFVNSRFGNNDGNLYKCLWPADLVYLGTDPDLYKFDQGGRRAYDLKINDEIDDYSDIRDLINVINNTPSNQYQCELEKIFNVNDYLKVMAFDILTANWDDYIFLKNNYYLYHNTATGKFEWIPYDTDNTYGIDWFGNDWGNRYIYDWGSSESRPLFDILMANQDYRDQFSFYAKLVLDEIMNPSIFIPEINDIKEMITPYIPGDPYYPLDYGYTFSDFLNSYDEALGGHVKYGLKEYVNVRYNSALDQLILNDINPIVKYINNNFPSLEEEIIITAYVEDEDPAPDVKVQYSIDDQGIEYIQMYDDGQHGDGAPGDKIFGALIEGFMEAGTIDYQILAIDESEHSTLLPCDPVRIHIGDYSGPLLYINEFMASNNSTIADEHGEYDDWIEVYNGGPGSIWLGDKYLSDKPGNPGKWKMPYQTLSPGEFMLFWADNSPAQGHFHTNFRLNKDGEDIVIADSPSTGYGIIDEISFGLQETDISYGRMEDGRPEWQFFENATPGYSNTAYGIEDFDSGSISLNIYPNPNNTGILYLSDEDDIQIYDMSGRLVLDLGHIRAIDINHLEPSLYFVKNSSGDFAKLIVY